jgi:hypothetical protein
MSPDVAVLLEEFKDVVVNLENLRMFLSSVNLLQKATGGWGEITLDFKGGDIKEARIMMTQKPQRDKPVGKV